MADEFFPRLESAPRQSGTQCPEKAKGDNSFDWRKKGSREKRSDRYYVIVRATVQAAIKCSCSSSMLHSAMAVKSIRAKRLVARQSVAWFGVACAPVRRTLLGSIGARSTGAKGLASSGEVSRSRLSFTGIILARNLPPDYAVERRKGALGLGRA